MSERRTKYNARVTRYAGRLYHSKLEADVAATLALLQRAGQVRAVRPQVPYVLLERRPAVRATRTRAGRPGLRQVVLIVDFEVVRCDGRVVCLDAKGVETSTFRLKARLWAERYPTVPLVVVRSVDEVARAVEEG